MGVSHDLLQQLESFFEQYYRDTLAEVAQSYPKDTESLYVDYQDLFRFDPDLADDLRNQPDTMLPHMAEAVDMVELPADIDLSDITVRVENIPEQFEYAP